MSRTGVFLTFLCTASCGLLAATAPPRQGWQDIDAFTLGTQPEGSIQHFSDADVADESPQTPLSDMAESPVVPANTGEKPSVIRINPDSPVYSDLQDAIACIFQYHLGDGFEGGAGDYASMMFPSPATDCSLDNVKDKLDVLRQEMVDQMNANLDDYTFVTDSTGICLWPNSDLELPYFNDEHPEEERVDLSKNILGGHPVPDFPLNKTLLMPRQTLPNLPEDQVQAVRQVLPQIADDVIAHVQAAFKHVADKFRAEEEEFHELTAWVVNGLDLITKGHRHSVNVNANANAGDTPSGAPMTAPFNSRPVSVAPERDDTPAASTEEREEEDFVGQSYLSAFTFDYLQDAYAERIERALMQTESYGLSQEKSEEGFLSGLASLGKAFLGPVASAIGNAVSGFVKNVSGAVKEHRQHVHDRMGHSVDELKQAVNDHRGAINQIFEVLAECAGEALSNIASEKTKDETDPTGIEFPDENRSRGRTRVRFNLD